MPAKRNHPRHNNNRAGSHSILLDIFENFDRPIIGYWRAGMPLPSSWPKVKPEYYRVTLSRMKKRGWIQIEQILKAKGDSERFVKLTKKGKIQALLYKLQEIQQPVKKSWDGKWRLALFDIPEQAKFERNRIRRTLKRVGFCSLQKSVYAYPFEVPADAVAYLRESGLDRFVRFARVDRMDNDEDLKRRFGV